MSKVDQFQSLFRAADKPVFEYRKFEVRSVLVVTDLAESAVDDYTTKVRGFLSVLGDDVDWTVLSGDSAHSVESLLALVEDSRPDLVCTYRNLYSETWRHPFSLGEHVDVLTQKTEPPVLLLPHPLAGRAVEHALDDTDVVMAMTDHLAGEARLVNVAARFAAPGGRLLLTHVEDEAQFERVVAAFSRIPSIDTDEARDRLREQLLKEPTDYIRSCRDGLAAAQLDLVVEERVAMGHHLTEYKRIVFEHRVDLLVMRTQDEDQLAMHGRAYPLAVELREIPLLLI